ncbi:MAG: hypothetical protein EP346_11705 [Bacteroidetes bacterium]|nr:MAG: hypothetical protein EP346_11705 [Bacteroidota bacterium]
MKKSLSILLILLGVSVFAQREFTVGGYLKYLPSQTWVNKGLIPPFLQDAIPASYDDHLIHNRLNFSFGTQYSAGPPWWSVEMGVRNRIFYGYQSSVVGFRESVDSDPGLVDLKHVWNDDGDVVFLSEIDRLFFHYETNRIALTVGRQRINWGIHNVFNPNDIFNQYNYFDFDYEERPGTDAVNFQYNLGDGYSSVSLAYSPSTNGLEESTLAALYKSNYRLYDYQLLVGYTYHDVVIGGGWAGAIGGVGFKGEFAQYISTDEVESESNFTATIGGDYMFGNGIYASLSYLYNGLGSLNPTLIEQLALRNTRLSSKNIFPYRHTLMLTASYNLTSLWALNFSWFQSHNFDQAAVVPGVTYSISNNWDAMILAQMFTARDAEDNPALFNTTIFGRVKWSF